MEAVRNQTTAIYALVDTLRDQWRMPALPLRSGETPNMRPTRRDHPPPRNDDDESEDPDDGPDDDPNDPDERQPGAAAANEEGAGDDGAYEMFGEI